MRGRLAAAEARLTASAQRTRHRADARFRALAGRLENLSPLAVLGRGYAVCWNDDQTAIVRSAATVSPGDRVHVTLASGEIDCRVETGSTGAIAFRRSCRTVEKKTLLSSQRLLLQRMSVMDPTIKDFESAIAELETIVKTLEEGDLALEKSLALFERGVQLSRFCHCEARGGGAARRDPQRARRDQGRPRRRSPATPTERGR